MSICAGRSSAKIQHALALAGVVESLDRATWGRKRLRSNTMYPTKQIVGWRCARKPFLHSMASASQGWGEPACWQIQWTDEENTDENAENAAHQVPPPSQPPKNAANQVPPPAADRRRKCIISACTFFGNHLAHHIGRKHVPLNIREDQVQFFANLAWNASLSSARLDRPGERPKRICPVDGCGFITPYLGSHLANTPTGCLRARPSIRSILLPAESLWSRKWKWTMQPMDHHHLQDHHHRHLHHRHLHHHKHLHQQQHHPPLYKLILVTWTLLLWFNWPIWCRHISFREIKC